MRVYTKLLTVVFSLGLFQASLSQEKVPAPRPLVGGVAATVNGQPIPEKSLQAALRGVPPDKMAEARTEILNHFIDNTLLEQHMIQLRMEVQRAEVDKSIAEIKEQMGKAPGQSFEKWLQGMNLTEEELRSHITADLRWQQYVSKVAVPKVLEDYFTKNPEMFDGSLVRARHILLTPASTDAQAAQKARTDLEQLRRQIEQAAAAELAKLPATADALTREKARAQHLEDIFSKVAMTRSTCPSKDRGGDLGSFPRAGSMVEPFARTAFALPPFQLSEPVNTQFGVHLILVTERKPGKPTKFEEIKDGVKEVYADRVLREGLLAQLRPKAKVVVTPPAKP